MSSVFLGGFFLSVAALILFARMFCIARHLAAEFGTRLAAFSVYVIFAMGG